MILKNPLLLNPVMTFFYCADQRLSNFVETISNCTTNRERAIQALNFLQGFFSFHSEEDFIEIEYLTDKEKTLSRKIRKSVLLVLSQTNNVFQQITNKNIIPFESEIITEIKGMIGSLFERQGIINIYRASDIIFFKEEDESKRVEVDAFIYLLFFNKFNQSKLISSIFRNQDARKQFVEDNLSGQIDNVFRITFCGAKFIIDKNGFNVLKI